MTGPKVGDEIPIRGEDAVFRIEEVDGNRVRATRRREDGTLIEESWYTFQAVDRGPEPDSGG